MENLLNVEHLTTAFRTYDGEVTAVNDVSFHVKKGEILGLVESPAAGKA